MRNDKLIQLIRDTTPETVKQAIDIVSALATGPAKGAASLISFLPQEFANIAKAEELAISRAAVAAKKAAKGIPKVQPAKDSANTVLQKLLADMGGVPKSAAVIKAERIATANKKLATKARSNAAAKSAASLQKELNKQAAANGQVALDNVARTRQPLSDLIKDPVIAQGTQAAKETAKATAKEVVTKGKRTVGKFGKSVVAAGGTLGLVESLALLDNPTSDFSVPVAEADSSVRTPEVIKEADSTIAGSPQAKLLLPAAHAEVSASLRSTGKSKSTSKTGFEKLALVQKDSLGRAGQDIFALTPEQAKARGFSGDSVVFTNIPSDVPSSPISAREVAASLPSSPISHITTLHLNSVDKARADAEQLIRDKAAATTAIVDNSLTNNSGYQHLLKQISYAEGFARSGNPQDQTAAIEELKKLGFQKTQLEQVAENVADKQVGANPDFTIRGNRIAQAARDAVNDPGAQHRTNMDKLVNIGFDQNTAAALSFGSMAPKVDDILFKIALNNNTALPSSANLTDVQFEINNLVKARSELQAGSISDNLNSQLNILKIARDQAKNEAYLQIDVKQNRAEVVRGDVKAANYKELYRQKVQAGLKEQVIEFGFPADVRPLVSSAILPSTSTIDAGLLVAAFRTTGIDDKESEKLIIDSLSQYLNSYNATGIPKSEGITPDAVRLQVNLLGSRVHDIYNPGLFAQAGAGVVNSLESLGNFVNPNTRGQ